MSTEIITRPPSAELRPDQTDQDSLPPYEVLDAIMARYVEENLSADAIIERDGLKQVSDVGAIEKMVEEAIAANPKAVAEIRAGKEKALNALAGQVMKASKGKTTPAKAQDLLRQTLA
ncbi:hypothetical protein C3F00_037810 [Pseudomonas sp. MWU13-2860]|nr:hypothetical protein C3F00_037810 [Pseudomonas sp. MWU13-2860]